MTFALAPDLSLTDTDGGTVLLDQRTGRYWMLNPTGATTLRMIIAGEQPDAIVATLTERCPDQADRAKADVTALLVALRKANLVVES